MHRPRAALALTLTAAAMVLTACSPGSGGAGAASSATSAASQAGGSSGSAAESSSAASSAAAPAVAADANAVLLRLQAAGLPITGVGVVTAENDPNHLLGRPNGYTSKVYWVDSSIDASQVVDSSAGSVEAGGAVEYYPDAAGATARADYIQSIGKASPLFAEYDYVIGTAVLRLSIVLTPDQAGAYKTAAGG